MHQDVELAVFDQQLDVHGLAHLLPGQVQESPNITASMASLRGWVLTGNPEFKTERAAIWAEIAEMRAEIDRLSVDWSNAEHIAEWDRFKSVIDEFAVVQKQVEDVANTPDQLPATKILLEEAAPAAEEIIAEIGKVIEIEKKQTASRERRRLLAAMADIASTTSMAFSDMRAYLLTGDEKDRESYLKNWKQNEQSFGDLSMIQHLFTREQSASLTKLVTLRGNFKRLPNTMFEIRGSEKWDLANFLLVTEVSPRADQLLDILLGAKNDDGSRTGGLVGAQEDLLTQDAQISVESASRLRLIEWGLLFAGLGIATVVTLLITRSIAVPVRRLTDAMNTLANGDTNVEIPAQDRQDEIGGMARRVEVFKANAAENARLQAEQDEVKNRAQEERRQARSELASQFESRMDGVVSAVSSSADRMRAAAEEMSGTAKQTSHQSETVTKASSRASENVQAVATASEQLSSSISEICRQVSEAARMAQGATDASQRNSQTVQGLAEAAQKVGEVVDLISDIASQTNLLALNATIESARAGEAGKGFAVVASEVKSLANQTARATEDIAGQISAIQSATEQAVDANEEVSQTIVRMNEVATTVASEVEEQGSATGEISRNVQEAAKVTDEVSVNTAGITQAATQTGNAANEVLESAKQLSDEAEKLRSEVQEFAAEVRAA